MDESNVEYLPLIEKLILHRKEVPNNIWKIYTRIIQRTLKEQKNENIQLRDKEIHCDIPEKLFQDTNRAYETELCEQINLLNILMKMKHDPISRIIDEI
ncbi:hypothetical protein JTB14_008882 [Gonioctena quinquepunctata]|nr:hypothetical protein JTB14_008882 [Gonioctena quinquepunctata]